MDRLKDLKRAVEGSNTRSPGKEKASDDEEDVEMDDFNSVNIRELGQGKDDPELETFFQDVEKMKGWMTEIRSNVDKIKKTYADLLAEADTSKSKGLRDQLATMRNETNDLAGRMRTELKKMRTANDEYIRIHDNDPSLTKLRTNMHGSLVRTFFDLIQEYQTILSKHDAKMREKAYRQVKLVAPEANEDEINEVLDQGGDVTEQIFAKHIIQDRKHQKAQQTLEYLQERHNDLLDLEKAISELQALFQDMAILVEAQGDLIDQIQFSVSQTKAYHEKAGRTLGQVAKTKTKIRKKKILVCLIITFTVLYVLVVILAVIGVIVGVLIANNRSR